MADRYFVNSGNWGTTTNWSSTSGGLSGSTIPTSTDDVYFDINSGNCTVDTVTRDSKHLNFSGYSNTITMSNSINVNGNVVLSPTMTINGSGTLFVYPPGGGTYRSNGKFWPNVLSFRPYSFGVTYTLLDDWVVSGLTFTHTAFGTLNLSGNNIYVLGDFKPYATTPVASGNYYGSTNIILNGTGTWLTGLGEVSLNVIINTPGTITIGGPNNLAGNFGRLTYGAYITTPTLTYISGTVITTGSTLVGGSNGNFFLNTSGMSWNNASLRYCTLLSDLNLNGSLIVYNYSFDNYAQINGNYNINTYGGVDISGGRIVSTATTLVFLDNSVWIGNSIYGDGWLQLNTNIKGNLTINGSVFHNNSTLKYISGVVQTSGSTLVITGNTTLDTSGMTWNNVTANPSIISLPSELNIGGTFTVNTGTVRFSGSNVNLLGSLRVNGTLANSTNTLVHRGTGIWSGAGRLQEDFTINTPGVLTVSGTVNYDTGILTHISGSVITTGSTLALNNSTSQFFTGNTSGITWHNVSIGSTSAAVTATLLSPLNVNNLFTTNASAVSITFNGSSINLYKDLTINGVVANGTSNFIYLGTGTWNSSVALGEDFTINTPGTLYFGSTVNKGGASNFTYSAGTVITTGSTLSFNGTMNNCTFNFNNLTLTSNIATNTDINVLGNLSLTNPSTTSGGFKINVGRSLLPATNIVSGNMEIVLNGNGIWSGAGAIATPLTINTLGTIYFDSTITKTTNTLTYSAGTVITTGSTLTFNGTMNNCTFNFNNLTLNSNFTTNTNINVLGNFTPGLSSSNATTGAFNFNVSGSLTPATNSITGTMSIILNGTGVWQGSGIIGIPLTINTPGTISVVGTVNKSTGTLTYTAGNLITTNSTLGLTGNFTVNTPDINWSNLSFTNGVTTTLSSNLNCLNNTIFGTTTSINTINGNNLIIGGSLSADTMTVGTIVGTTNILLNGTGTLSTNTVTTGGIRNNLTINTNGVITMGTGFGYGTGTFNLQYGRVNVLPNSTFRMTATGTLLNLGSLNFNNVVITSGIVSNMNEFFNGRPDRITRILPTTTTNYTVNFISGSTEQFTNFVKISGATVTNRGQLTVLTDKGNLGGNVGIKFYPNQLANGLPKNNPSVVINSYGVGGFLTDPGLK